jgi:hypothetical protein
MTLRPFLAVAALLIGAVSLPASAQQNAVSVDGKWTGRTSQKRSIAFRIEAGAMQELDLDWTMHVDEVCPGLTGSAPSDEITRGDILFFYPRVAGFEPPAILFPSFTVSREVETSQVPVTVKLAGTFGSDNKVSGEMILTAAGCPGRETIQWQASMKTAPGGN